jgi:hypothetical protein
MPQWRIDTLDARGGLAFASWRDDDLVGAKNANREPPSIFIGAPDFRPEPVANRAIALAAGRGAFQTRLFVDGVEASFPTPTAVVEFVRRAYLRSGGGDGADGGGGETPLPRPSNPPDMPRLPDSFDEDVGGRQLRPAILSAIKSFQKLALGLTLGKTEAFNDWPLAVDRTDRKASNALADGPGMLASAALRLIYEMVQRLPFAKEPHALARWQRDARRLGRLLARLDLWPLLLSDPYHKSLTTMAEHLARVGRGLAVLDVIKKFPPDVANRVIVLVLFVDGPDLDDRDEPERFMHGLYDWLDRSGPGFWLAGLPGTLDPIPELSRIPLPQDVEECIGLDLKIGASLYHALAAFMGSPIIALKGQSSALIDLVLFASACVVGPDSGQPLSLSIDGWQSWRGPHNISPVRRAAAQTLAGNAWNWLREHLPGIAFPRSLEKAIESAANLRYTLLSGAPSAVTPSSTATRGNPEEHA